MKMSPVTRMMVMSDRYKKSSNGERQQDGRHQMEQPRYNEDYVGRKARERQGMRHGHGTLYTTETDYLEGIWQYDRIVKNG